MVENQVKVRNSETIKQIARRLGFSFCGLSEAGFLKEEAPRLEDWLKNNMQGKMSYMENHFDMRLDPRILVPGARSVISLMYNYFNEEKPADPEAPKISMYAYGKDYHKVIRKKLKLFIEEVRKEIGHIDGRVFVDSAPVLEKAWAARSGIGWIGKNSNLINPKAGSWFFLAELISDLEIEPDGPARDYCGTCTACIDACPTDAIVEPYKVDGSRCISYFTIELKDEILPTEMKDKFANWAFGCDICQEVCPWNRFSKRHHESQFDPPSGLLQMTKKEWEELNEELFENLFRSSAVKRTGFKGLKRNIAFLKKS